MNYPKWIPAHPVSSGATAYHNAVVNTSWHKQNINGLINIVKEKIKTDDVVVDFGAGTGSSTIYLLRKFKEVKFLVVDNSPSWLGKAYELLHKNINVNFLLLNKIDDNYIELHKLIGENTADHILSFNTVHLIPDIKTAFQGIYFALKKGGVFSFQSGNIILEKKYKGILMIDDSIGSIHDLAIEIIKSDKRFKKYKKGLANKIKEQNLQRSIIFPQPRSLDFYLKTLKSVGFKNVKIFRKQIRIKYNDWIFFLKVKRLQAGILPEIGGRFATPQEFIDRDIIITEASKKLFVNLEKNNPLANTSSFCAEWVYIQAEK